MDLDARAKPREQKVTSLRTKWKILLLILCLLHGSSMTPPLWTCYTIVSTNQYTHHDYRGRVALTDVPQSGLFMVRLLQLSLGDTGLYRCGIGDRNDMLFFSVNLTVSAGPSNTTYAAAPASSEPVTASPGTASSAANRWTSGVTQVLDGRGSEWDRSAPTTDAPRETTGTMRLSVLISEHGTWETLQDETKVSKQQMLYSLEGSSPAPSAQTLNATCMEGRTDGNLGNTPEESSPLTPSQLSAAGPMWVSGKGSSMKSTFTERESDSRILTPVSIVLALLLIAALVLLKRRLGGERTSQKTERVPRITLIQMTHFPPDKLPGEGKNLQQSDLPTRASLTVLEKDPGL